MRLNIMRFLPLLLITSCSSGSLRYAGAPSPASDFGFREAAELAFKCDPREGGGSSEGGGALPLAPFIGIAVDTAINAISGALARAQRARTASWSATKAVPLSNCPKGTLTVTRGIFDGAKGTVLAGEAGPGGRVVFPAFVLELEIKRTIIPIPGKPKTAIVTITPKSLNYAETAARSRGSKRKEVTVAIAFGAIGDAELQKADSEGGGAAGLAGADEAPPAGAMLLNLGKLEIGRKYQMFQINAATSLPLTRMHTATAIVTESEEASAALTALAAAFESNKGDLSAALKTTIEKALRSNSAK